MAARVPIVFVITDLHVGGAPRVLRDLAMGIARASDGAGHSPVFVPSVISLKALPADEIKNQKSKIKNESIPEQLRAGGVPVHSLNLSGWRDLPGAVPRLAGLLNRLQPAIVYSILIHANALAAAARPFVKNRAIFIQSIHTLQPRPAWHWTLQGVIAPCADAIIAPAKPILDKIAQYGPFQRGIVIPNGIDLDRFANASPLPASELPWPAGSRVIGYVGRFDPVKNLPLLLRAFARLVQMGPEQRKTAEISLESAETSPKTGEIPAETAAIPAKNREFHLALVGYGPERERLGKLATSLHLAPRVHFVGPTDTPERWYKSFTCHCLPSTVEGFGLTLVEAMVAGIPVVAIRTAVAEQVLGQEGGGGRLVDRPDEVLLADALQRVTSMSQGSVRPSSESSEGAAGGLGRFSVREMVGSHLRIFQDFSRF